MFYDEPRRAVGDLSPSAPNLVRYCPPATGSASAVPSTRRGPTTWAPGTGDHRGRRRGPPTVTDPALIPNGAELLQMWEQLLERTRNGN